MADVKMLAAKTSRRLKGSTFSSAWKKFIPTPQPQVEVDVYQVENEGSQASRYHPEPTSTVAASGAGTLQTLGEASGEEANVKKLERLMTPRLTVFLLMPAMSAPRV